MDEDTTTASDSIELGDATPSQPTQPVESTEAAAQSPEPTTTNEPSEPSTDDNSRWLQSKGIDKSDPEWESKLIANAREAERLMSQRAQEAAKLQNALAEPIAEGSEVIDQTDVVSTLQAQVEAIQLENNVNKFFSAGGDAELASERKALEPAMSKIVTDNPAIGQMVKVGYMSYEQLAALAKGSDPSYGNKLKQDGGREALETVANKQQARAHNGIATNSAMSGDTPADPFLDGFNSI